MNEPRRHFTLPVCDQEYLDALGMPWEALIEGQTRWVLVHLYRVVPGYSPGEASIALELPAGYPDTQIDMAYFHPHLLRADGKAIPQVTDRPIDCRVWQRWSRHRTGANPWRRDCDCIETHLLLVNEWLERELRKVA